MMTPDPEVPDPELEGLLQYIRDERGFDLTVYKRGTLSRRVTKYLRDRGIASPSELQDRIEATPSELTTLLDTVLINVSAFFRDMPVWRYVADEVIPQVVERVGDRGPIRVWSAGCATGEEPFTIAILLAEALGRDALHDRVKIFATDVDEGALALARAATYSAKDIEHVPEGLVERYFTETAAGHVFDQELRRAVIFGRNDLIADAPISRLDLLVCRNTLIYLNSRAQETVVRNFVHALKDDAFLVLGKSELLTAHRSAFDSVSLSVRVFRKLPSPNAHGAPQSPLAEQPPAPDSALARVFEDSTTPQLVVDSTGTVVLANRRLRMTFGLEASAVGSPLQDLELSYRPVELRSLIDRATKERRPMRTGPIEWRMPEGQVQYEVEVRPLLLSTTPDRPLLAIAFVDITRATAIQEELEERKRELETAYEELQSTVEELETTNEELQSTNEELETTNEELQSTNEELETTNEELHSNNEELSTINEELQLRTDELDDSNRLMGLVLETLGLAAVLLDKDLRVGYWNDGARTMWGFDEPEVIGRPFLSLELGLPVDPLRESLFAINRGDRDTTTMTIPARDRRGHEIECRVRATGLRDDAGKANGLMLLMDVPA